MEFPISFGVNPIPVFKSPAIPLVTHIKITIRLGLKPGTKARSAYLTSKQIWLPGSPSIPQSPSVRGHGWYTLSPVLNFPTSGVEMLFPQLPLPIWPNPLVHPLLSRSPGSPVLFPPLPPTLPHKVWLRVMVTLFQMSLPLVMLCFLTTITLLLHRT